MRLVGSMIAILLGCGSAAEAPAEDGGAPPGVDAAAPDEGAGTPPRRG